MNAILILFLFGIVLLFCEVFVPGAILGSIGGLAMLAGCILGPARGFAAATLYLALGAVGLPVFAEHSSGIGTFAGPSGGWPGSSRR